MKKSVAIVTGSVFPHEDNDELALRAAIAKRNATSEVVAWDDPTVDWATYDIALIRSTWDYTKNVNAFLDWAAAVDKQTILMNPSDIVSWNANKRYLSELGAAGIAVVPTRFVDPFEPWSTPEHVDYVIKPAVSGGGRHAGRFLNGHHDDLASALANEILKPGADVLGVRLDQGRTLMIQPYVASVDIIGETSLIFAGNDFSHAIRKGPVLAAGGDATKQAGTWGNISPLSCKHDEMEFARHVLDAIPGGSHRCLYARVDIVRDDDHEPMLLELELIEPSLFLYAQPGASDKLVDALFAAVPQRQ